MIHFEDIRIGDSREYGSRTLTAADIIRFGKKFDPQPFHVDERAAADSFYGGLIASGWHTAAIAMRLMVDGMRQEGGAANVGSPGFDDLKWLKPVRPGDTLRVRTRCIDKRDSRSNPALGSCRFQVEVVNQRDEIVMSYVAIGIYLKRQPAA